MLPLEGITIISIEQAIGEQTAQILRSLGYRDEQINQLRAEQVI